MEYKNIVVYGIIAVAVAAAAAFLVYGSTHQSYSVSVSITGSPTANMYPFESTSLKIYVNNTGTQTISDLPVTFYLNGNPVKSYEVTLPGRSTAQINESYIYPFNGSYQFQAVADPGHVLSISDRAAAQGAIEVNVSPPQEPSIFSSIPNSAASSLQGFSLFQNGTAAAYAAGAEYNISFMRGIFGPASTLVQAVFKDLYSTINVANGAEITYNGTQAYSLWLQGTLGPNLINAIARSFSFPEKNVAANGTNATMVLVGNTTSLCFFYHGGWTKLVAYDNATGKSTCAEVVRSSYNGSQKQSLNDMYNSSAALKGYASEFFYRNSSYTGTAIENDSNGISSINVFQNAYGTFISYAKKNAVPVNITRLNLTCYGIIYMNGTADICSSLVPPAIPVIGSYALINETEITSNFTFSLYSFVNQSNLLLANQNGVDLIKALNVSEQSAKWKSAFKNSCQFSNASLACEVVGFNQSDGIATLNITSRLSGQARINSAACYFAGVSHLSRQVNQTIRPNGTIEVSTKCYTAAIPITSATTTYILSVNYTYNGRTHAIPGELNITNMG